MPKPKKAFLLRLSEKLYTDLENWAERDFRSVNAQIEYLLQQLVDRQAAVRPPLLPPLDDEDPAPEGAAENLIQAEDLDLSMD